MMRQSIGHRQHQRSNDPPAAKDCGEETPERKSRLLGHQLNTAVGNSNEPFDYQPGDFVGNSESSPD